MVILIKPKLVPKGHAITIYPFILLNNKEQRDNHELINHERIHLKQQAEMLIIPFYIAYAVNYAINLFRYDLKRVAYRNIIFEKEAYSNKHNLNYIETRKFWGFLKQ